jgi:hypothetical protein
MKNFSEYKKDIERELMIKIIIGLRHGKITERKAEELAKEYMSLVSVQSTEELFRGLSQKIEKHSEILEVYLKTATEYFGQKKDEYLQKGREYMKKSQYDHAVHALKGENIHG